MFYENVKENTYHFDINQSETTITVYTHCKNTTFYSTYRFKNNNNIGVEAGGGAARASPPPPPHCPQ